MMASTSKTPTNQSLNLFPAVSDLVADPAKVADALRKGRELAREFTGDKYFQGLVNNPVEHVYWKTFKEAGSDKGFLSSLSPLTALNHLARLLGQMANLIPTDQSALRTISSNELEAAFKRPFIKNEMCKADMRIRLYEGAANLWLAHPDQSKLTVKTELAKCEDHLKTSQKVKQALQAGGKIDVEDVATPYPHVQRNYLGFQYKLGDDA